MQTYKALLYTANVTVSTVKRGIQSLRVCCFPFQSTFLKFRFKISLTLTDSYILDTWNTSHSPIRDRTTGMVFTVGCRLRFFLNRNVTCVL